MAAILNLAATAQINLSKRLPDLTALKILIDDIQQSGRLAAEIVRHMRSLLRKRDETEVYEKFDIDEIVDSAIEILKPEASKRGVLISVQKSADPLMVRGDQVHLEQVILNLAVNAMDAMVNCAPAQRKLELRTGINGGSEAEVSVIDLGTGIPEPDLNNIFNAFHTTKKEGTGLGLSVSRTILEQYGGKIWAERGKDMGMIFKFTLPLRRLA